MVLYVTGKSDDFDAPVQEALFQPERTVPIGSLDWSPELWRCLGPYPSLQEFYEAAEKHCVNCKPGIRSLRSPNIIWSGFCE